MTTIGLSFKSTEIPASATEILTAEPVEATQSKKRISLFLIPSTIGLGLLLTFGYVGGRIFSASAGVPPVLHTVEIPPPPQPGMASVKPAAAIAQPAPIPQQSPDVNQTSLTLITPRTGESYLQLAALPPKMAMQFIDDLKKVNIEAGIAQGPTPDMVRVLAGPFASPDLLNQTKAKLDALKMISMARDY
jgi:cell division septation protein DedD